VRGKRHARQEGNELWRLREDVHVLVRDGVRDRRCRFLLSGFVVRAYFLSGRLRVCI
jgi:hypothetical protein